MFSKTCVDMKPIFSKKRWYKANIAPTRTQVQRHQGLRQRHESTTASIRHDSTTTILCQRWWLKQTTTFMMFQKYDEKPIIKAIRNQYFSVFWQFVTDWQTMIRLWLRHPIAKIEKPTTYQHGSADHHEGRGGCRCVRWRRRGDAVHVGRWGCGRRSFLAVV